MTTFLPLPRLPPLRAIPPPTDSPSIAPGKLFSSVPPRPLLIVVEGPHDVTFLQQASRILAPPDPQIVDLVQAEARHQVLFLPIGGGYLWNWVERLAPLGLSEFHLYDRELSPETSRRQALIDRLQGRAGCRAYLTSKRSLENFLPGDAIERHAHVVVSVTDDNDVSLDLAIAWWESRPRSQAWFALPERRRKKLREQAKRFLHHAVVPQLTPRDIARGDPAGEIRGWLREISGLLTSPHA